MAEQFRCHFGLNPRYRELFASGPLKLVGFDRHGDGRIVELANHRFFVATLFLPQLSSQPGAPHPLVIAYLRMAVAFRDFRVGRSRGQKGSD